VSVTRSELAPEVSEALHSVPDQISPFDQSLSAESPYRLNITSYLRPPSYSSPYITIASLPPNARVVYELPLRLKRNIRHKTLKFLLKSSKNGILAWRQA